MIKQITTNEARRLAAAVHMLVATRVILLSHVRKKVRDDGLGNIAGRDLGYDCDVGGDCIASAIKKSIRQTRKIYPP